MRKAILVEQCKNAYAIADAAAVSTLFAWAPIRARHLGPWHASAAVVGHAIAVVVDASVVGRQICGYRSRALASKLAEQLQALNVSTC